MKTVYDDNFLNGQLFLEINEDKRIVDGEFIFYDDETDEVVRFTARSKCRKGDNWSEFKGVDLVKSKLAREYHKMYLNRYSEYKRELLEVLKEVEEKCEFRKKKVKNIEKDLSEYFNLTYWRKDKNPVTPKKKK